MKLDALLTEEGIPHGIVPTPRWLSESCGIVVAFDSSWEERVRAVCREADLEPKGVFPLAREAENRA